jgi:hypothetical protein
LYHDCDDYITELAKLLLSHEPIESGTAPLQLTDENFGNVPRVYVECTEDRAVTPFIKQEMYTETPCEKFIKWQQVIHHFSASRRNYVISFATFSLV